MSRRRSVTGSVATVAAIALALGTVIVGGGLGATASATDVGAFAASAGCGKNPTLTSGTRTIQSGGQTRTFTLRLPDGYDRNRQYRLIFGFHWLNGSAGDVVNGNYYGLLPLSNNSAIFVAPHGLNAGWANSGGQDVTFTDNMIQLIENDLCVDTSQRFSLGFSYGGGMSYALACARANVFRAVAVYAGGVISGCSGGNDPIGYLHAHGVSDNVLSIAGGRSMRDRFVRNNGCTPQNAPEPSPGSGRYITTTYTGCTADHPVVWHAFDGGHTPTPGSWLPQATWQFFAQFQGATPGPTTPGPTTPGPTTPGPTTPGPTTAPPSSGACRVTATVNAWNTGLTEDLTFTNTGTAAINGWSLTFTLPSGQSITNGWNATYSPNSGQVTARNMSYNGTIAPNASVSIGFQATHTGNTGKPTSFSLNGASCTVT